MSLNFTPASRLIFHRRADRIRSWDSHSAEIQESQLRYLLKRACDTKVGRHYRFSEFATKSNVYEEWSDRVVPQNYEDIRADVIRMIAGQANVLWPGVCRDFAQSSGTSGGKSKFIPITSDSLRLNHYPGASDAVAHYLSHNPNSRLFAGKGLILGGSFDNELKIKDPRVHVGDLSATLINKIPPLANLFRVPSKEIALMPNWEQKLPVLVQIAANENITNLSGVPSWFLTLLREVMEYKGVDNLKSIWPNLEVFFHGGISFEPYREEYAKITDPDKMHFVETYNASEGFFAVQNDPADKSMLLGIDEGIFYEFMPLDGSAPLPYWEVEQGKVYEMVITGANGLWRYRLGDTVRIEQVNPVKITIAGRTKCFINAFGEELMEDNAERAIAEACARCNAATENYTAAPYYAHDGKRGHHQWLIEWRRHPTDISRFAMVLDEELRKLNSDYDAKRKGGIFLDPPEIIDSKEGAFDRWLLQNGNHKLGGQRKVPRLSNDRRIIESVMSSKIE